jgi:hypothetical protein
MGCNSKVRPASSPVLIIFRIQANLKFRGAVLSQLPQEALIVSNQATRHYGVSANAIFDEEEDDERNKMWDPVCGVWQIRKVTNHSSQPNHLQD